MDLIDTIFGEGKDLTALQMGSRAVVIFFLTLAFIHIAGMRTFGQKSAFDNIIIIMLGAILSRAVVGVSPFLSTLTAALVLVLTHRVLAWMCLRSRLLSRVVKGEQRSLFKEGQFNEPNMRRSFLSRQDIMEGVRMETNTESLEKVEEVIMETSGRLSVIKKDEA